MTKHFYLRVARQYALQLFLFEIVSFYAFAPQGRGWQCILQFFHDDIMASFAITFSGDIGIVLFRLTLGLNSLERNDIVLFLLTLRLQAQK